MKFLFFFSPELIITGYCGIDTHTYHFAQIAKAVKIYKHKNGINHIDAIYSNRITFKVHQFKTERNRLCSLYFRPLNTLKKNIM